MRKLFKLASLLVLLGTIALVVFLALRRPSLSRDWDEDVRILAGVEMADDGPVALSRVRNWRYAEDSIVSQSYLDAAFDPADIVDIWMYEQQLDDAGLIAHTFLVFEFDASYGPARYLGLSVETRRESGEEYSLIGGMLRAFEVTHVWATERDLVTRRVQYLDYPLTRYRLEIPEEYRARIFVKLAQETGDLAITPRWYNTATNNCTSSLIKYVNESEPGAIPLHYSYVLTGTVDDYLERLGYLDAESALAITRDYLAANELR
ncbi:MAG: DUF4105 domain-containing protein [Gemmatimonadota bacterium]